jgi:hypothetical protein
MDLPGLLVGLLPVIAIGFVCVVAFRRRHDRRHSSPMIVNPYTLAIERDAEALGHPPVVQPGPETTRSQTIDVRSFGRDDEVSAREEPTAGSSPKKP